MKRRALSGDERRDWLRLSRTQNVGPITFFQLIDRFSSASAALAALPDLLRKNGGKVGLPSLADIDRELMRCEAFGARFIAACEPDYSPYLAAIPAAPPLIALAGRAILLQRPSVALVGARNASAVGRKMARDLARNLGEAGYAVVSGMARGVDAEAHSAALDTGTAAVLGGGVDHIYPPENGELYRSLCERGAVISESAMGYVARPRDFPRRNRLISGLSLAVVVVEAAERSGSLITARAALDQGREVMAVPGSPLDPRAAGSNRLIKQGAALIENAEDVILALESFTPPAFEEPPTSAFEPQPAEFETSSALLAKVREALSPTPVHIAEIVRAVGAPHRLVVAAVAELELAGFATTFVGGLASSRAPM